MMTAGIQTIITIETMTTQIRKLSMRENMGVMKIKDYDSGFP